MGVGGGGISTTSFTPMTPSPYTSIVDDHRLSLDDRISFAATYLDDVSVLVWLKVFTYVLFTSNEQLATHIQ